MPATAVKSRPPRGPWKWGMAHGPVRRTVPALLWTLKEIGGVIEDTSGQAGLRLAQMAAKRGMPVHPQHDGRSTGLSQLIRELDIGRFAGCIARDVGNKRTYKLTLLLSDDEMPPRPDVKGEAVKPEPVRPRPVAVAPKSVFAEPEPTPEPTPELVVAAEEPEAQPEVEPEIPPLVAVAQSELVDRVLQMSHMCTELLLGIAAIGQPVVVADDAAATRLADTLVENERLRRKANEATETARARANEADQLRKALKLTQANLEALRANLDKAPQREQALNHLRSTQRTMQAVPNHR